VLTNLGGNGLGLLSHRLVPLKLFLKKSLWGSLKERKGVDRSKVRGSDDLRMAGVAGDIHLKSPKKNTVPSKRKESSRRGGGPPEVERDFPTSIVRTGTSDDRGKMTIEKIVRRDHMRKKTDEGERKRTE